MGSIPAKGTNQIPNRRAGWEFGLYNLLFDRYINPRCSTIHASVVH